MNIISKINESVEALTEVADTYAPAAGKKIIIGEFDSSFSDPGSEVDIIWDYGGAEQVLFSTPTPRFLKDLNIEPPKAEFDGVKELAVVCKNNLNTDQFMFCRIKFYVDDDN